VLVQLAFSLPHASLPCKVLAASAIVLCVISMHSLGPMQKKEPQVDVSFPTFLQRNLWQRILSSKFPAGQSYQPKETKVKIPIGMESYIFPIKFL